jgi:hypothetical protein
LAAAVQLLLMVQRLHLPGQLQFHVLVAAQVGLVKAPAVYPQAQMALLVGQVVAGATTILLLPPLRAAQEHLGKVFPVVQDHLLPELVMVAVVVGLVVLELTET